MSSTCMISGSSKAPETFFIEHDDLQIHDTLHVNKENDKYMFNLTHKALIDDIFYKGWGS